MHPLSRALRRELLARYVVDLTTATGAKWKHGWIPLNAAAEAILAAKSEHGATLSHEQMHAMKLVDLKKHYSETIKAHGFQHNYTKKVGKAVGSHPESLAKTAATKAASKPPAVAETPEPIPEWEKELMGALPPPGKTVVPVLSKTNQHIGYLVADTNAAEGKKHSVYNLNGEAAGHVNSFSGAQHVLGSEVGKPKPPHELTGQLVTDVAHLDAAPAGTTVTWTSTTAQHTYTKDAEGAWQGEHPVDPGQMFSYGTSNFHTSIYNPSKGTSLVWGGTPYKPQAPWEKADEPVASVQALVAAPVGTKVTLGTPFDGQKVYSKQPSGTWVWAGSNGTWSNKASAGFNIGSSTPLVWGDATNKVDTASFTPTPKAPAAKVKVGKDPTPPKQPPGIAPGWAIQTPAALDAAPVGTKVSDGSNLWQFVKQEDGSWSRTAGSHTYNNQSSITVYHHYAGVYWGDQGPNKTPPEGYDPKAPRYGLQLQGDGRWGVVDYYNGGVVTKTKAKPGASKKANDLNLEHGTPTAKQIAQATKTGMAQEQALANLHSNALKPEDLNHPQIGVGASDQVQMQHTFDGSKAGELGTVGATGNTTDNEVLFNANQTAQDAKRRTARRIADRMAQHFGLDDQEKLDAAWQAMAKQSVLPGYGQTIHGFQGIGNPYHAHPTYTPNVPGDLSGADDVRGTPEFRAVMREHMVATMIQTWAASSNDDHAVTLTLQDLAEAKFGVPDVAAWHTHSASTKAKMEELKADPAFAHFANSFLQAQYDDTQATLQARGVKRLTVRRGMKSTVGVGKGGSGVLKMRPMSSWSTNAATANSFAGGGGVYQTTVPVEKVLGFAGSGFGCSGEYEVVLIGGNTHVYRVK